MSFRRVEYGMAAQAGSSGGFGQQSLSAPKMTFWVYFCTLSDVPSAGLPSVTSPYLLRSRALASTIMA